VKRILVLGLFLAVIASGVTVVHGQGFIPLVVHPAAVYLRFPDEPVYENVILIRNDGEEPLEVAIELRDFTITSDGTFLSSDPEPGNANSLAPYITYSPNVVALDPGEQTQVHYRIELPDEGGEGPFWGTLVVSSVQASPVSSGDEREGANLGLLAKMIYPVAIMVHSIKDVEPQAELSNAYIWLGERDGHSVLNARFEITNQCDDLLCCSYTLRFFGADGMMINEQTDPTYRVILPGMSRPFGRMYLADYLPNGTYTVELTLNYEAAMPLVRQLTLELGGGT